MNRSVQLYIEGQRIELFNDETINVTSSIQNVQDLSKTYTDFSQGFTVPASSHNNAILEHWYQSDVNATADPNLRKDGFIEIDLTTFRKGKVQLDGAVLKNGKPEAYKLTFYGEGVTLKDLFGEDLLSDLDFTDLSHDFNSAEVIARIEDATDSYDVKYPLITSNRIWKYQGTAVDSPLPNWLTSTSTNNDIHTTSGSINKDELFPAVRVVQIIKAISNKYGINFNGAFLGDERFTKLFLWFKNKERFIALSEAADIDFTTVTPTFTTYNLTSTVNTTDNSIHVEYIAGVSLHRVSVNVTSVSSGSRYYIDVYQNGNLFNTIQGALIGSYDLDFISNVAGLDTIYTFKIRTEGSNNIALSTKYEVQYFSGLSFLQDYVTIACNNVITTANINLSANAPQIKVADFLKGLMLQFNMTIYSLVENEYWLEPLDDWYSKGAVIDITEFTDVTSIEMERMPLYKKITLKFQDSECFLNKYFSQTFNRNYGDTTYQYNYDGGEFTIEVPFENLLQTKFTGTSDIQLGYSLNSEFAPYIPKPVLLYQYINKTTDFKFKNDSGGHTTITTYTPFGQDLEVNAYDITLNFAPETSTLLEIPIQETSFSQYYFSYLYNLYNLKQRLVNVKTNLPTSLLTSLQLNDRVIIRDKRYIINQMQSNLTTGDVNLQLLLDFRPVKNLTFKPPKVGLAGGNVFVPVLMAYKSTEVNLTTSSSGVTFSDDKFYQEAMVKITVDPDTARAIPIEISTTYEDGTRSFETIYVIQE